MQRRRIRARAVVATTTTLGLLALAGPGLAQPRTAQPASTGPIDVLPPASDEGAPGDKDHKDGKDAAEKKTGGSVGGYAYGDRAPATGGGARHTRYRSKGPVVNMPGFEQTGDGGSRLFVQLSQSVPVEEHKAQGSVTYVLKGASPRVWNNTNALVTVHFNTPVSRARLVPQGNDLLFVVDLRAAATPTWKLNEGNDKTATLAIEFPKGEYLAAGEPPPAAADGAPRGKPAPASRGKRATKPPSKGHDPASAPKP